MDTLGRKKRARELVVKQGEERQKLLQNPPQIKMTVTVEQPLEGLSSLGNAVKVCRKNRGFTQQSLADYAGVGRKFIGDLEQGKKETLEIGKVLKVCQALGIDLKATYTP